MAEIKEVKPPMVPPKGADKDSRKPKAGGAKSTPADDPKPKAAPKSTKPRGRQIALEKKLEEFFTGIATVLVFVNPKDAAIIEASAPKLARAYAKLANENAYVKKILERLVETSAWGEAVMVTGMVLLPIASNHGLIPGGIEIPMPDIELD